MPTCKFSRHWRAKLNGATVSTCPRKQLHFLGKYLWWLGRHLKTKGARFHTGHSRAIKMTGLEILRLAGNQIKAAQPGAEGANLSSQFFPPPEEVGKLWPAACFCKYSSTGAQPCTLLPGSSVAAFVLQQQSRIVAIETVDGPRSLRY